jgi:hypothetical protein
LSVGKDDRPGAGARRAKGMGLVHRGAHAGEDHGGRNAERARQVFGRDAIVRDGDDITPVG